MSLLLEPKVKCACCGASGSRWFAFGDAGPTKVREDCVTCPDCKKVLRLALDKDVVVLDCRECGLLFDLSVPIEKLGLPT